MKSEERVKEIFRILRFRGENLSLAESCTGGLVSAHLTDEPGASAVFVGSVVSYSGSVKNKVLGVPVSIMKTHGEVSLPTARAMAQGVRRGLGTTWGLSVTGIAGPSGGTALKPVGFVCFGLIGPGVERLESQQFRHSSRQEIRQASLNFALDLLRDAL